MSADALLLSCEHGGNRVPAGFAQLFSGSRARAALAGHRGYDPGALAMARALARKLGVSLHAVTITRLLVEQNRSLHHRKIFSEFSAALPIEQRQALLERYYLPHRQGIVDAILGHSGRRVCHVSVHSFSPTLDGVVREADVALLYDPSRRAERDFCSRWLDALRPRCPELRLRRNYPYRGTADGLTTALRRQFSAAVYLGIELETNQALLTGPAAIRARVTKAIGDSLEETLAAA